MKLKENLNGLTHMNLVEESKLSKYKKELTWRSQVCTK